MAALPNIPGSGLSFLDGIPAIPGSGLGILEGNTPGIPSVSNIMQPLVSLIISLLNTAFYLTLTFVGGGMMIWGTYALTGNSAISAVGKLAAIA